MKIKPKILCPISDWKETKVNRGPATGKIYKERMVLGADKFNFFIGTQVEGSDILKKDSYFHSLKAILRYVDLLKQVDKKEFCNNLISELVKRTGKTPKIELETPYENLVKLGEVLDKKFNTNFMKPYPPVVYYHLFGKELGINPVGLIIDESD